MQRRDFLKYGALAMGASALPPGCANLRLASSTRRARHPNIVFMLVDDLGYGDVSCYYLEGKIKTPNIDRLANQGMRFTDAHSGAAVCSPTRYGILTGQHFSRVDWSRISEQLSRSMIEEDRLTVGDFLQQNGYHTGCFGKWHLGYTTSFKETTDGKKVVDWDAPIMNGANDRGFDSFYGLLVATTFPPLAFVENRYVTVIPSAKSERGFDMAPSYKHDEAMSKTTQRALEYIDWNAKERPDEPFFLYFPTTAIHTPVVPGKDFVGKSEAGLYGDFVLEVDHALGQVVSKLEEHGIRDDTLIIFTSDNGGHGWTGTFVGTSEEDFMKYGPGSVTRRYGHRMSGPWRGKKGTCWEGGHRVPFIASWPGRIEPGSVCGELITLEDFMATCAAIVGKELPANSAEDSYNILPYLKGTHRGGPIRKYAVLSAFQGDHLLRKDNWVLTFHLGPGDQWNKNPVPEPGGPKGQLYNLKTDPRQEENLWLERPDKVAELTAFYKKNMKRGRSFGINR